MVHDYRALETARQDAQNIVENNLLQTKDYQQLKEILADEEGLLEKLD